MTGKILKINMLRNLTTKRCNLSELLKTLRQFHQCIRATQNLYRVSIYADVHEAVLRLALVDHSNGRPFDCIVWRGGQQDFSV